MKEMLDVLKSVVIDKLKESWPDKEIVNAFIQFLKKCVSMYDKNEDIAHFKSFLLELGI